MATLQTFEDKKPYLSIIGGRLTQKVDENTPGAVRREYETKKGDKGVKYELQFKNINGRIQDLRFKDSEFGESLEVVFENYILSMGVGSRYFSDFVKKLASADINKDVTISPFDFESDGKKVTGVSIYQGANNKMKNFFWDEEKGAPVDSFPKPAGDTKLYNKAKWTIYYLGVDEYLKEIIEQIKTGIDKGVGEEGGQDFQEEEFPAIEQEQVDEIMKPQASLLGKEEDEVRLEDVPF
jgi:hypothetical protein